MQSDVKVQKAEVVHIIHSTDSNMSFKNCYFFLCFNDQLL